jgi:hypothetical protein
MPRLLPAVLSAALTALCPLVAYANFVTNPGFETEALSGSPAALLPAGWTVAGTGVASDTVFPNAGIFDMVFNALTTDANLGVLSQSIATTSGTSYLLTFAALDEAGFSGDSLKVGFGGFTTTITGDQAASPGTLPSLYTAESFLIPGSDITGSAMSLTFMGLSDPISGFEWNLDDVSVTSVTSAIPEPSPFGLLAGAIAALLTVNMIRFRRGA